MMKSRHVIEAYSLYAHKRSTNKGDGNMQLRYWPLCIRHQSHIIYIEIEVLTSYAYVTYVCEHNMQLRYWPQTHTTQITYQIYVNWGIDLIHICMLCNQLVPLQHNWINETITYILKQKRKFRGNERSKIQQFNR